MYEIIRLEKAIHHFRTYISSDMSSLQIAIFLSVAEKPGITMHELMNKHTTTLPTINRNVSLLTRNLTPDKNGRILLSGHDLLETRPVKNKSRSLAVYLTHNGKFLLHEIQDIFNEGNKKKVHNARKPAIVSSIKRIKTASVAAK